MGDTEKRNGEVSILSGKLYCSKALMLYYDYQILKFRKDGSGLNLAVSHVTISA